MTANNKAMLQMLVCSMLWSISGVFFKLIHCHPIVIAGIRSVFAAVTMLIFMFIRREKIVINRNVLLSAVFLSLTFICFVTANKMTTAANAIVIQYTAPVFILIFSVVFLHQRFSRMDIIVVVATLLGISMFFLDKLDAGQMLGNVVALGSGISMAVMYIAVGNANEEERMSGLLMGHLMTALIGLPFLESAGDGLNTRAVMFLAILGVVQLGIPYILFALANKHCSPLACALIGSLEPLLNPVWVAIFDGERPGIFALFGGLIVIISIGIWCIWRDKTAKKVGMVEAG